MPSRLIWNNFEKKFKYSLYILFSIILLLVDQQFTLDRNANENFVGVNFMHEMAAPCCLIATAI